MVPGILPGDADARLNFLVRSSQRGRRSIMGRLDVEAYERSDGRKAKAMD